MKKLIFIITLLAFWGCEENPVSTESVEIDWILIKNPQMIEYEYIETTTTYEYVPYTGVGYTFIPTSSVSNINMYFDEDLTVDNFNGILTFSFNSENYSYDISDSYHSEMEEYLMTYIRPKSISKISCYDEMSYCHTTMQSGLGYLLELTSPFEIIDYR